MYTSFFGMSCNPFLKEMNISHAFKSRDFKECITRLSYLTEIKGLGVFFADPGLGKSFILNYYMSSLNEDLYKVIYFSAKEHFKRFDFFKELSDQLDLEIGACYTCDLYNNIQKEIVRLVTRQRIQPVIIIDDAHYLSSDLLQNLKVLLSFDTEDKDYSIVVLCGNLELRERLIRTTYESIKQRIIVNYQLQGLTREEVKEYVESRFELANVTTEIFTPEALNALYSCSKAIPRRLNSLILNSLMLGYQNQLTTINEEIVRLAKNELDLN